MRKRIAVAISGGIDSLMAAHLLIEAGHDVTGIHFITGYEPKELAAVAVPSPNVEGSSGGRGHEETIGAALCGMEKISRQLGIPVEIVDISTEFKKEVVDYFTDAYLRGLTPNPCLICNPRIKFGLIMNHAQRLGAARIATGHYARVLREESGAFRLAKGVDPAKDQSYFLAFLSQQQLKKACFPLGGMTKAEVKRQAAQRGLSPTTSGESQDICFITGGRYTDFLSAQPGFKAASGPIETVEGKRIGTHGGLHMFTVGQRRGINCPAPEPYYVVRIDPPKNSLIVGFRHHLETGSCHVSGINWITGSPEGPQRYNIKLRYRHKEVPATLIPEGPGSATIRFDEPQSAVTPGQGAVFYSGSSVMGAGLIDPGE